MWGETGSSPRLHPFAPSKGGLRRGVLWPTALPELCGLCYLSCISSSWPRSQEEAPLSFWCRKTPVAGGGGPEDAKGCVWKRPVASVPARAPRPCLLGWCFGSAQRISVSLPHPCFLRLGWRSPWLTPAFLLVAERGAATSAPATPRPSCGRPGSGSPASFPASLQPRHLLPETSGTAFVHFDRKSLIEKPASERGEPKCGHVFFFLLQKLKLKSPSQLHLGGGGLAKENSKLQQRIGREMSWIAL